MVWIFFSRLDRELQKFFLKQDQVMQYFDSPWDFVPLVLMSAVYLSFWKVQTLQKWWRPLSRYANAYPSCTFWIFFTFQLQFYLFFLFFFLQIFPFYCFPFHTFPPNDTGWYFPPAPLPRPNISILGYCCRVLGISVADPDPFDTDPDPAFHCDTDPDPTYDFQFDTDPDPCRFKEVMYLQQ